MPYTASPLIRNARRSSMSPPSRRDNGASLRLDDVSVKGLMQRGGELVGSKACGVIENLRHQNQLVGLCPADEFFQRDLHGPERADHSHGQRLIELPPLLYR